MMPRRPDDDAMLSVLLTEILGDSPPPDLTAQILDRLEQTATLTAATSAAQRPAVAPAHRQPRSRGGNPWLTLGSAAALLAVAASAGWLLLGPRPVGRAPGVPPRVAEAHRERTRPPGDAVAQRPAARAEIAEGETPATDGPVGDVAGQTPLSPRQMEMAEVPFGGVAPGAPAPPPPPLLTSRPRAAPETAEQIVRQIDLQLFEAWQSLAVQPTETADAAVVASRLEAVIGVRLPPEQTGDIDAIRQALRTPQAQQHTAGLLAHQLLGATAWARLKPASRDVVIGALAEAVAGRRGADRVLAGLLAPEADSRDRAASEAWLAAIGGKSPAPLVEHLGNTLLDLDLRCGRCHDHPSDRSIRQSDYWSLAAALHAAADADAGSKTASGLFYELPDGRQRAASPGVPVAWLGGSGRELAEADRKSIADSLVDNRRLAAAMVNRLWQIAYGHPLVGAASDPQAPPHDAQLVLLRDHLAEQLRAHDFDLGEAIAWLLAAAPLRLEPPRVLLSTERLLASDQALAEVQWQVRSFAAFDPTRGNRQSLSDLLAAAGRFQGGATLGAGAVPTTLAQSSGDSVDGRKRSGQRPLNARQQREALLRASFPSSHSDDAPGLPAAWLASVDGFDQQVRHLYYVAGYSNPTARQIQAAAALRGGVDSDASALNQIWWAVQHSATP